MHGSVRSFVARIVIRIMRDLIGGNRSTLRRGLTIGSGRLIATGLGQWLEAVECCLDPGQLGSNRGRFAQAILCVGHGKLAFAMLDAREDRLQAVVVLLRDGIEFVVVAPRTLNGQAQERRAGGRDHVVQIIGPLLEHSLDRLVADDVVGAADQKACGRLGEPVGTQ